MVVLFELSQITTNYQFFNSTRNSLIVIVEVDNFLNKYLSFESIRDTLSKLLGVIYT